MLARYIAIPLLATADRRGITSVEYAVFAAAVVETVLVSSRNFVTALAGIINSLAAAL